MLLQLLVCFPWVCFWRSATPFVFIFSPAFMLHMQSISFGLAFLIALLPSNYLIGRIILLIQLINCCLKPVNEFLRCSLFAGFTTWRPHDLFFYSFCRALSCKTISEDHCFEYQGVVTHEGQNKSSEGELLPLPDRPCSESYPKPLPCCQCRGGPRSTAVYAAKTHANRIKPLSPVTSPHRSCYKLCTKNF